MTIKNFFKNLWSKVKSGLSTAVHGVGNAFHKVGSGIASVARTIGHGIGTVVTGVKNIAVGAVHTVKNVGKFIGKEVDAIVHLPGQLVSSATSILTNPLLLIGGGLLAVFIIPKLLEH